MKTYTATGVTLLARKFRGSQRVVTFYTREQGKVEAVAAGIGKPGSSLTGAVEPFTLSRLFFASGRDLDHLTQAQVLEAFPQIAGEVRTFGYGAWLAELTARATESGQPCPPLFEALLESLRALAAGREPGLVAAAYALRLLEELGLAPVLEQCAACGGELPAGAWYNAAAGGLLCESCRGQSGEDAVVRGAVRGALGGLRRLPPERLGTLRVPPEELAEILRLLRAHLAFHLGFKLKSDGFLKGL